MSARFFSIFLCALASATTVFAAEQTSPPPAWVNVDSAVYGLYPENYKEIVNAWLEEELTDFKSAIVEFIGEPKPAEMKGPKGAPLYGFKVEFRVNSRNAFGAYTGMQRHSALIRNGAVVKATGFL